MRNIGLMVITMISPKTEKKKNRKASGPRGENGSGPASSDESAENGEGADGKQPAAAGKRSGRARQGPLIVEKVRGKMTGATLTAACEALSLNEVI